MEVSTQFHKGIADTYWIGGWVGLRAGLEAMQKKILGPAGFEPQLLGLLVVARRYANLAVSKSVK
jgi:hypothetical protein